MDNITALLDIGKEIAKRQCQISINAYYKSLRSRTLSAENDDNEALCPPHFDGLLCWDATEANTTASQHCTNLVIGYDENLMASKTCWPNGTWARHPDGPEKNDSWKGWTNYTTCINQDDLGSRQIINNIYFFGYCLSLFALIISVIIFLSFRSLRCTRIKIHIHLFTSLALNCIAWLLFYKFVVGTNVIHENPEWCIVLHILTQYFMCSTYFWMFCEGVHLHLVLVVVFIKDYVAMRIFFVIGWIVPLLVTVAYSTFRWKDVNNNKLCWIDTSVYTLILVIPVVFILVCSIVFLINIVRVLITKLHPRSISPAPEAIRKAVRATIILVPLFGLHHLLMPFRPENGSPFEISYQIIAAILISLQGFCVSILFCFANHEVMFALSCSLRNLFPRNYTPHRESLYTPAGTTSRDMVV